MKLVLVAGFNPRVSKIGPKVRLFEGRYRICTENIVNSKLVLCTDNTILSVKDGSTIESMGGTYWLGVSEGTEEFINVFAEYVSGTVDTPKL